MAKLASCPNGHFYDADRWEQCPYCGQPEHTVPIFPDRPEDEGKTAPLESDTGKTMPLDEGKTVPLQEEVMNKTQPLNDADMNKTQPLDDAGAGRTVPLVDVSASIRQSNWQPWLLRIALGVMAFGGLLAVFQCVQMVGRLYDKISYLWGNISYLWGNTWTHGLLIDIICCVVTCLCCVWCLRAKGAQPSFPLSVVLAAAGIGLALYGCNQFFRLVSWGELSFAKKLGATNFILINVLCLIAAILAWAAIFLYQRKMRKNS